MTDKILDMLILRLTAPKTSGIGINLPDERSACALAKRVAERTGRSVTVHDEDGIPLVTFHGRAPKSN